MLQRQTVNHPVDHSAIQHIIKRMETRREQHLDRIFAALSDRTRREILAELLNGMRTIKDLAEPFDMSLSAVSKHISLLVTAGLVTQEKLGREKWCRLDMGAFKPAALWIEFFGQPLAEEFDALEKLLEIQSGDSFLDIEELSKPD